MRGGVSDLYTQNCSPSTLVHVDLDRDIHVIWSALGELGDWFAGLGGAARYPGFKDDEIPLAVAALLIERFPPFFSTLPVQPHVDPRFWQACAPVLPDIRERISSLQAKESCDVIALMVGFIDYIDSKLANVETHNWPIFSKELRKYLATASSGSIGPEAP